MFNVWVCTYTSYRVTRAIDYKSKKRWATLGVVSTLSILAFFKYNRLLLETFTFNKEDGIGAFLISIPLPIGISFYTFQGISLIVDVYREKDKKFEPLQIESFWVHFYRTTFFKSFFPQLIAGPIVKAHDFFYQIKTKQLRHVHWGAAIEHLIIGYFLKCVIADNLKDHTFWIAYPYFKTVSTINLITMLFGYSMQIFADFAGYSYIAVGSAKLFGYDFFENFNWPYVSTSFSEFWRRWHISLSTFLKEYLYIPLGGNRKGELFTYRNLFITMFLGGLWHGAGWSYAVWGTAHGLALAIERISSEKLTKATRFLGSRVQSFLAWGIVFSVVSLAWLLFKLTHFSHAIDYFFSIFTNFGIQIQKQQIFLVGMYSLPVIYLHWIAFKGKGFGRFAFLIYALMLFFIVTNRGGAGEFIYFQF
jgi:alginate O-acetyltransferase complex protein AlgI